MLPILRFDFGNQRINEDIIGLLFFSLNHSNTNNSEKIKCRANLRLIFKQILGFNIKPLTYDESKLHKQELMTIAKRLESQDGKIVVRVRFPKFSIRFVAMGENVLLGLEEVALVNI